MAPASTIASAACAPARSGGRMVSGEIHAAEEPAMRSGKIVWAALALGAIALTPPSLAEQGPIKVGEINSYSGMAAFTAPYKNGLVLAEEEINAAGGVLGRKIEIITRDDGLKPEDAVRAANELVTNDKVALLAGGFLSNVGLALSDFAAQNTILFLASEPLTDALTWSMGNAYT